ncbi:MAG: hypothetical protein ACK51T_08825 [bacterium]
MRLRSEKSVVRGSAGLGSARWCGVPTRTLSTHTTGITAHARALIPAGPRPDTLVHGN